MNVEAATQFIDTLGLTTAEMALLSVAGLIGVGVVVNMGRNALLGAAALVIGIAIMS
ncbi:MAG: hypothetical protein AAFR79_01065 [Pseudomonadota bacterium]